MKVIYDFGSNNGDDIPYYLKKPELVVAVEANPSLADHMRTRFKKENDKGDVIIESCVLTPETSTTEVPFYIYKKTMS